MADWRDYINPYQMGGAGGFDPLHDTPMGWRVGHPQDNYAMTKAWSGQPRDYAFTTPLPNRPAVPSMPIAPPSAPPWHSAKMGSLGTGSPNIPGAMAHDLTWAGGLRGAGMGAEVTPGATMPIINDEGRTEYVPMDQSALERIGLGIGKFGSDLMDASVLRHGAGAWDKVSEQLTRGWQPQGSLPGEGASRPDPRFASSDDVVTPYRPGPRPTAIPMPDPREAARAARIARRDAMMAMNMGSGGPKVGAYSSDPRNESYDPWTALNDHLKEAILAQEREQMKRSD